MWNRRLRPWVLGAGVALHLGIDVFLDIGFFSIAIYLAYLAFLPDDVANQLVGRFDQRALEPDPSRRAPWATRRSHRGRLPARPASRPRPTLGARRRRRDDD